MPGTLQTKSEFITSIVRSLGVLLPTAMISGAVWYSQQNYNWQHHIEVLGFLATGILSILALFTLKISLYPTWGRWGLVAFSVWAGSSTIWRLLYFRDEIDASTRLLLNSLVASILAILGLYVLVFRPIIQDIIEYVQGGEIIKKNQEEQK